MDSKVKSSSCPVCSKEYPLEQIESHVDKCLFLNSESQQSQSCSQSAVKRPFEIFNSPSKKIKQDDGEVIPNIAEGSSSKKIKAMKKEGTHVPLAEIMRPTCLDDYMGQEHVLGRNKIFRQLIESYRIPSMILWGPPGCGKTTLAHIIHKMCLEKRDVRFVKLSATMAGVNDVKEIVQIAKNELKSLKRHTLLFMDEIHRFNKLQQDIFLPHVESGTITLLGATTENPSFSLNSALLSRCKVIVLEKLSTPSIVNILTKAAEHLNCVVVEDGLDPDLLPNTRFVLNKSALVWLAEMCDGDARIGLNSLQMALESVTKDGENENITTVTLEHIKDGIKRSHLLYDKKGDEHYNIISALHKSIRAGDDNAALYWLARMLEGGEDPLYIARRLVRTASEDVGLMDPMALSLAVSAMHGCQMIGMPECDVLLAQVTIYLARTHKSREVHDSLKRARDAVKTHKGALPSVPLHLRNASTRLMSELGYGRGYNMRDKDSSNLSYFPEGMDPISFFKEDF